VRASAESNELSETHFQWRNRDIEFPQMESQVELALSFLLVDP
jgi:hypothetical protein